MSVKTSEKGYFESNHTWFNIAYTGPLTLYTFYFSVTVTSEQIK